MTEHFGARKELQKYYQSATVHDALWSSWEKLYTLRETMVPPNLRKRRLLPTFRTISERVSTSGRSLWDRSLIARVDLEYHNFDNPAAPWLEPERAFRLQRPVLDATLQVLRESGILPLTVVSGRGFHLVWAVQRGSNAFRRLEGLGHVPASLQARYTEPCSPDGLSLEKTVAHLTRVASKQRRTNFFCQYAYQPTVNASPGSILR